MFTALCNTIFFKQFVTCLARYLTRNAVTLIGGTQYRAWILENLSSVKCNAGLACKNCMLFSSLLLPRLLFFFFLMQCCLVCTFWNCIFIRSWIIHKIEKVWGGDWRMRRKNIQKCMLEILGLRNAFIVNANNSPGQLYFDFFFLYVALRANIVHFGI